MRTSGRAKLFQDTPRHQAAKLRFWQSAEQGSRLSLADKTVRHNDSNPNLQITAGYRKPEAQTLFV
jgi:hypothetical protein